MKCNKFKWLILIGCVAVLILAVVLGVWQWRRTSFRDVPFGQKYSVVSVFFAKGEVTAFDPETPVYALTHEGYLLDIDGSDFGRLSSSFRKFTPNQENFDHRFHEDGAWRVTGIDAAGAREDNAAAWKYEKMNGTFYYVLLQKNGDVFLCVGKDGAICQFYWLQGLGNY